MLKKERKHQEEFIRIMIRKFCLITLGVIILFSCTEKSPVLIFENSSKSNELNVVFYINGRVNGSIIIPPFSEQDYQWSIRRKVEIADSYSFVIKELNSGQLINKKLKAVDSDFSFIVLGIDKNNKFILDTCSMNYIPPY